MTPSDEAELRQLATEPTLSHMRIGEQIDQMPEAQRQATLQVLRSFREALKDPAQFVTDALAER